MKTTPIFIALLVIIILGGGVYLYQTNKKMDMVMAALPSATPVVAQPAGSTNPAAPTKADDKPAAEAPAPISPPVTAEKTWLQRCDKDKTGYCEIYQALTLKENKQKLLEVAVGFAKKTDELPQAAIILPLGVDVGKGIVLFIDGKGPGGAPFNACTKDGCYVLATITEEMLTQMKDGKELTVGFFDGAGVAIKVDVPLKEFGTKLAELKAK